MGLGRKEFDNLDPFVVLGVSQDADKIQVRKAFRKQALKWHPDKHSSASTEQQEKAELEFKKVAWAYEVLSSSKRSSFVDGNRSNFDFASYWEEWGSTSWASFWERDEDPPPLSEEVKKEIKHLWDEEDLITYEQRIQRTIVEIVDYKTIKVWAEYCKKPNLIKSGIGRDQPLYNYEFNNKIAVWYGSLVHLNVDAVINAANTSLAGGGGLDGAIHNVAGNKLYDECDLLGGCATGNVAITRAYNMPCKYIIHACGPIGQRPRKLSSCYSRALDVAVEHNIRTIALPCISTGVYCYPLESATNVALQTTRNWLETGDNASKIDLIIFSCFQHKELVKYEKWMQWYFPISKNILESYEPEEQYLIQAPMEALLFENL